ncbi:uncharacterized protein B0H18DRAFT_1000930 [Fomitopsis serialis]|uniref:uncharacterized protein n=1 Tax=Fomitopsis serialis TaxID=139415 RepID=UPI00200882D4|nr:uncharacterized protein B0H18DRAFT_1000930 [Neoantrodia serialis]KAH9928354.1 hypothetical protein B0H18DRAFT_1000930 [Neoantrodia serialis]
MAYNHFVLLFGATFAAFVLLAVRFGVLGYCSGSCSATNFGYHYGTEITTTTSTILVLFPAAAGVSLLFMLCLFPLICGPRMHVPHFLLAILSVAASACSIAAFVVGAYLSASVISGFKHAGDSTNLGAALWMSLASAVVLTLVAANVGLGTCFGSRLGRKPSYV